MFLEGLYFVCMKVEDKKEPQNIVFKTLKTPVYIRTSKDARDDLFEREKGLKRDEWYSNLQDKYKYLK